MATLSTARLVAAIAKSESTYGTDSSPAGGTDDVTIIESENPWSANIGTVRIQPHRKSFTHPAKDLITRQLADVRMSGLFQGPTTRGVLDNGTSGMVALFKAAGVHAALTTGANGVVTLTQATKAQTVSATVKLDLDGMTCNVLGMLGNGLEIFADVTSNPKPRWSLTGVGLYAAPVIGTIGSVVAPDRAISILGGSASITPAGGSAYNCADGLILDSWRLRFAPAAGVVESMCSATGVDSLISTDRNPMLECTIAVDTNDSANLDIEDVYADLVGSSEHAVALQWGADPYLTRLTAATAQVVSIAGPTTKNGYRVITLNYKLYSATPEGEFALVIGNPA